MKSEGKCGFFKPDVCKNDDYVCTDADGLLSCVYRKCKNDSVCSRNGQCYVNYYDKTACK